MDINKHRDLLVRLNHLRNTDDLYTFYYDETNNFRRVYLTDSGLNVAQSDNFVLAGILHKGLHNNADFSSLFGSLNLQKTTYDLKLKHVAKGSFLEMLKSEKLRCVLEWLPKNGFFIHYFNLNVIYWSIVDIVDSIVGEAPHPFYVMNHMAIKSDLYELVIKNREAFLRKLHDFNYPDVQKEKGRDFCCWLVEFVSQNRDELPHFNGQVLTSLVKESLRIGELPFISGFHGKELISDFMAFYMRTLCLFKNSRHIFDEEHCIESSLKDFSLMDEDEAIINYEFFRSEDVKEIQLSDVIAGFLGKYFTYIKDVSFDQMTVDRDGLNAQQQATLRALKELVDVSDDLSNGFFNKVASDGEKMRNNWFLHEVEPPPSIRYPQ